MSATHSVHLGDTDHGGVSIARGCALLIQLRFRRLVNLSINTVPSARGRLSTAGKRRASILLVVLIAPLLFYQAHILATEAISGAIRALGTSHVPAFIATELLILFVALVAEGGSLKNKDLARLGWVLEWLLTLPVSRAVLQLLEGL